MIEVAVGEHNKIQFPQVDPHFLRIGQEQIRVTCIEQDFLPCSFKQEREPRLSHEIPVGKGIVINKDGKAQPGRHRRKYHWGGDKPFLKVSTKMRPGHGKTGGRWKYQGTPFRYFTLKRDRHYQALNDRNRSV